MQGDGVIGLLGENLTANLFRLRRPPRLAMPDGQLQCLVNRDLGHGFELNAQRK
jgi:hypothetical protein